MKKIFTLSSLFALALGAAEFAPGGVCMDLADFAPKSSGSAASAANAVRNGGFEMPGTVVTGWAGKQHWVGWSNVHGPSAKKKELMALTRRIVTEKDPASGKFAAALISPKSMLDVVKPFPMFSNKIRQTFPVPVSAGTTSWQMRFKMRGEHFPCAPHSGGFDVFVAPLKPDPKKPGKFLANGKWTQRIYTLKPRWQEVAFPVTLPAGTTNVQLTLALYQPGEAYLDDVAFTPKPQKEPIEVKASPFGFMDNCYAVGEKLPGVINFVFSADEPLKRKALRLEVLLPPGFAAVDSRDAVPILSRKMQKDGSCLAEINLMRLGAVAFLRKNYMLQAASLMVKAPDLKASGKLYPLRYRLSDGPWQGNWQTLNLKVIPAVTGKRPRLFRSSAMFGHEFTFTGKGIAEAVNFYDKSGFSAVHGLHGDVAKAIKELKLPRYNAEYYLCNGFRLGAAPKPDHAQFKMADGRPFPRKVCPVEVYKEGPYFKAHIRSIIENAIVKKDYTDNIMSNWEPYYLDSKGCFCDRCREEFILWAKGKPSAQEIRKAWPKDILRLYSDRWMKFRSFQHGRLMATLEKHTRELGKSAGKDSHFIPEISWNSMTLQSNSYCKQYNVLDYMDELPWLEPWGPYNFYQLGTPYNYYPAIHLNTYLAAQQMKLFAKVKSKPGKEPKLIAFPHGFQGEDWITEPEAIAFETLCFFVQGWEGVFLYYFPRGYDYRYWQAMARTNTVIAENENFVMKGKDVSGSFKVVPRTVLPENLYFPEAWTEPAPGQGKLPGLHKLGAVQLKAFQLGREYAVAVGNFWQKGEHFFELKGSNLPKGSYQLSAEGCDLGRFSEKELAKGVLLQVGALRWQFIRITPAEQAQKGLKPFPQKAMRNLMKARTGSIEQAAASERKLYLQQKSAMEAENPVNDLSKVKVSGNGVAVTPAGKNLQITAPDYKLILELEKGGQLSSFQSRGGEFAGNGTDGWIGRIGFWYPRKAATQLDRGFKLEKAERSGRGVKIVLSRRITPKDNLYLAGLEVTRNYLFEPGKINLNDQLKNSNIDAVEYALRLHSLPAVLGKKGTQTGIAAFGDGATYTRSYLEQLFRLGAPEPLLEGSFHMDKIQSSKSKVVTLKAPWLKAELEFLLPPQVRIVIFWDNARQSAATFEPVWERTILAPGGAANYSTTIHVKQGK